LLIYYKFAKIARVKIHKTKPLQQQRKVMTGTANHDVHITIADFYIHGPTQQAKPTLSWYWYCARYIITTKRRPLRRMPKTYSLSQNKCHILSAWVTFCLYLFFWFYWGSIVVFHFFIAYI